MCHNHRIILQRNPGIGELFLLFVIFTMKESVQVGGEEFKEAFPIPTTAAMQAKSVPRLSSSRFIVPLIAGNLWDLDCLAPLVELFRFIPLTRNLREKNIQLSKRGESNCLFWGERASPV